MRHSTAKVAILVLSIGLLCARFCAATTPAAERGFRLLTEKAYLPPDFDQSTFDEVWQVWPEPLRSTARDLSVEQRRQMAFKRYGLSQRADDTTRKPLQYVVDELGNWTMNCFSCHGGSIEGHTVPGRPNSDFALETLTAEIRRTKRFTDKPLTRMDIGSLFMPLGTTTGTTNSVMFGVALMARRDANLNVFPNRLPPKMIHHDMDAPAWWHFKRKKNLYIDGFAPKGVRALMQFMLVEENGPEKFQEWERDFQDIYAFLESIPSPVYPYKIDHRFAIQGRKVFEYSCAECHGTYGPDGQYPEKMVPINQIGTDRVRLEALTPKDRRAYARSWFAHYGKQNVIENPGGYVAPPLDGIWASAPYLHNGSVPTLWHLLRPDRRPTVWKRAGGHDQDRVGLTVDETEERPKHVSKSEARTYFDTRRFGKSAAGHDFPEVLDETEKRAVLEYLKTL